MTCILAFCKESGHFSPLEVDTIPLSNSKHSIIRPVSTYYFALLIADTNNISTPSAKSANSLPSICTSAVGRTIPTFVLPFSTYITILHGKKQPTLTFV